MRVTQRAMYASPRNHKPFFCRLVRTVPSGLGQLVLCAGIISFMAGCAGKRDPSLEGGPVASDRRPCNLSRYGNPENYEVFGKRYYPLKSSYGFVETGLASWYGPGYHGRRTSNGEIFNMHQMTAAHRILPLPTYAEVHNLRNGRKVMVKINDRGPFYDNRIIDLSYGAAKRLGIVRPGVGLVRVRSLDTCTSHPLSRSPVKTASLKTSPPRFYLQLGAFPDKSKAERIRRQIHEITQRSVRIQPGLLSGKPVYKVQVGPLASAQAADQIAKAVALYGFREHWLVLN